MISAVIITFNEERIIAQCLDALSSVTDEVIVVDSFSSDRTVEICEEYGATVSQHAFEGYRAQKDYACSLAKHPWILSLDADEVLSKELIMSLNKWRKENADMGHEAPLKGQIAGYSFNRLTDYCGKFVRYGGWYPDRKLRFYHHECGNWSGPNVHEFVEMYSGFSTKRLEGDLLHFSISTPADLLRKLFTYSEMGARFMFEEKRRTSNVEAIARAAFRWFRQIILQRGVLDGELGFTLAYRNALSTYWKYRRLNAMWEGSYENIMIIAIGQPSHSDDAVSVSNAIKWFLPTSTVVIQGEYDITEERIKPSYFSKFEVIIFMDEDAEILKEVSSLTPSPKIIRGKRGVNTSLTEHGMKLLHQLDLPALYRFPEKKDWLSLRDSFRK